MSMPPTQLTATTSGVRPAISFQRRRFERRTLFSIILSVIAGSLAVIAAFPLFSVLYMLIVRGGNRILEGGTAIFTQTRPGLLDASPAGGFGNAILGTIVMVAIAGAVAIPFGVLGAIFLAEFGGQKKSAVIIRFCAKILTGFPSILAGVFAYTVVVYYMGTFSAIAGGIALSVLMIPIVMLTAEESIKLVPDKMRQAATGMGATKAQVTWQIVVPTALPGILTGVMLAVARAAGETAPLLFTALGSDSQWAINPYSPYVHLAEPTASMAVFIFKGSGNPAENLQELAWACSLVLVILVLIFNIGGQFVSRNSRLPR